MKRIRSPLSRRFKRELRDDFGKYLVIFLLMLMSIGFVSGFLVADNSMIIAYEEGFEKYNVEHGNFQVRNALNAAQEKNIRKLGVSVYENFHTEIPLDNGSVIRIFKNREEVNLVCLMEGSFPEKENEIAVDRMYADNNHLKPGDAISGNGKTWIITGLIALPDYSCLFQNNSDSMFDAIRFGVGVVSPAGFAALSDETIQYSYSWKYPNAPENDIEANAMSEDFLKQLRDIVFLEDYVPAYQNQAITFTGEDMGSDKSMVEILLYIIIVIIAFVFAVTIQDTIRREAAVIGTLRASGYTKGELLQHYITLPFAVTLISALLGNILGYTVMKKVAADMYYASYSLPTYVTVWNSEAFLKTTLIPLAIMIIVTGGILIHQLQLPVLRFLRRDFSRRKKKGALHLPHSLSIMTRWRIRIIVQNLGSYAVLFIGILFANFLLMFGMQLPKLMDSFQDSILSSMIANYQYILKLPFTLTDESASKIRQMGDYMNYLREVSTDNPTAEKFSVYSLKTQETPGIHLDYVMLYGIADQSRYVALNFEPGKVFISDSFAEKYSLKPGDTFVLEEEYKDKSYTFTVGGIASYPAGIAVFMPMKELNKTVGLDESAFAGYFSETPITDIKAEYISTLIDENALTKVSRQIKVSMGDIMYLVDVFAVIMYMILIFLLSRMIIEKNALSISLSKILGFSNREVSRLYIASTTVVVVFSMIISIPLLIRMMVPLFTMMLREMMSGWLPIRLDFRVNIEMFLIGIVTYALVAVLEQKKIRSVPLEEALKNVE